MQCPPADDSTLPDRARRARFGVRGLLRPGALPASAGGPVEFLETHASLVLLASRRGYKVKKPVRYPFLDFSTLERRYRFCREEVRLNQALAPGVYRRVVAITRSADGSLRVGGEGPPVEWAVEMVRLPDGRILERLLEAGPLPSTVWETLAQTLVRFHAGASRGPEVRVFGRPEAIAATVLDNLQELAHSRGALASLGPSGGERIAGLQIRGREALRALEGRFLERVERGRVCEGHGDLHAGNLCVLSRRIIAFDRLEFSLALRSGDVASDLAFLTMDLTLRGHAAAARTLARRYAELAEDPELLELLPFYETHRALVRAKVAALAAESSTEDTREVLTTRARSYLEWAERRAFGQPSRATG